MNPTTSIWGRIDDAANPSDYATANRLYLLEERVHEMIENGRLPAGQGVGWLDDLKSADRAGVFFSAVTGFTVVGQKP